MTQPTTFSDPTLEDELFLDVTARLWFKSGLEAGGKVRSTDIAMEISD